MAVLRRWLILCLMTIGGCGSLGQPPVESDTQITPSPAFVSDVPSTLVIPSESVAPDVWTVLREGFSLDHAHNEPAVAQAALLLRRVPMMTGIERPARSYLAYIVDEVRQRGLPMELALLPIIESALDPYAYSHSGASGLWQLIPNTAKHYGVTIDWWYDGRRDLVDSTNAALNYLTDLHDEFGDWLLAIAAYNSGEGRVRRAIAAAPGADFFDLKLPRETRQYVPKLLALAHLIAADDGRVLSPIDPTPPFVATTLERQFDLAVLARVGSLSLDEIYRFNPGWNRIVTPPAGPYRMLVPASSRIAFTQAFDQYPTEPIVWTRHRVRDGENLALIAKRYRTSVASLRSNNQLTSNVIRPNQSLLVSSSVIQRSELPMNPLLHTNRQWRRYKVKAGDSLARIGKRFGTTTTALIQVNALNPNRPLQIGQMLKVPIPPPIRRLTHDDRCSDSTARVVGTSQVSTTHFVG
ncbi:MAG: transglycosylase SLT domain-containing protein [Proteobacteria bacterium]|nr:transglycosylase SLT domain-containing protein [Pseudomonadota bacterium]